jgi:hypothetical protein
MLFTTDEADSTAFNAGVNRPAGLLILNLGILNSFMPASLRQDGFISVSNNALPPGKAK